MVAQKPWDDAILEVLGAANEPLHYLEITERIIRGQLRRDLGQTPERTVSARLTQTLLPAGIVERTASGVYSIAETKQPPDPATVALAKEEDALIRVAAYGLYWDRDKVNWNPGQGRKKQLLGSADRSTDQIDFSEQSGIYVLYNRLVPMYVGRTDSDYLLTRLESHNRGNRRNARWDQFSWFGFRRVEGSSLSGESENFSTSMLITVLETVMIEAFIPPLNDKGGDLLGTMYRQVEDPFLVEQRNADFRQMIGKAIIEG